MKIIGRDGQELLDDFWAKDGARAHKGITTEIDRSEYAIS